MVHMLKKKQERCCGLREHCPGAQRSVWLKVILFWFLPQC